MGRSQVHVRRLEHCEADLQALNCLWSGCRNPARGSGGTHDDFSVELRSALARADVQAFVAAHEGADGDGRLVDVGFMVLSTGPLLPLLGEPAVSIEHLFVAPDARRTGVARALLAHATAYAEQVGAVQISTSVPSIGRNGQRFFARLGFAPFVVRRVTTVAALRRRLTPQADPRVEATMVRRRSLRARSRALALRAHPVP